MDFQTFLRGYYVNNNLLALQKDKPIHVLIHGQSGSGRSTFLENLVAMAVRANTVIPDSPTSSLELQKHHITLHSFGEKLQEYVFYTVDKTGTMKPDIWVPYLEAVDVVIFHNST
ncbi:hypothetical protein CPB84DRAFT_1219495 [Gymnopilus junonius]|uniref:Uncharacterized protein n=1 Tax=Gymnopilus junonius TaxID=109634 RepID=A0A9P5NVU2_GYMJU|nr:hypothetical protein CPB84DRAFT_1219495 [Gymnopilus junonius]